VPDLDTRPDRSNLRGILGGSILVAAGIATGLGCGGGSAGGIVIVPPIPLTQGSADLVMLGPRTEVSIELEDRNFTVADCAWIEGLIGGTGVRRLLKFDTLVGNFGALDIILGDPTNPVPPFTTADFEYSPCHDHYHFSGFAEYELREPGGGLVGFGHKQAFCLRDSVQQLPYPSHGYNCSFQGISPGWADLYESTTDGQWVDVTGVPLGTYSLVITINPTGHIPEVVNAYSNEATFVVHLPDPSAPL
jgi:hypothetical protein